MPTLVKSMTKFSPERIAKWKTVLEAAHHSAHEHVVQSAVRFGVIPDASHQTALNSVATQSGPCGFAWVSLLGRSQLLTWLKTSQEAKSLGYRVNKEYDEPGHCVFWVGQYNQCMMWKQLYASHFAAYVSDRLGVKAVMRSRMD